MNAPPQRFFLRRWLNRIEVDQAVFYSVLAKGWQFLAGPVTLYIIAGHLSADAQGFYFAFLPLLAMQAFVELGMHTLTVYAASHEWARLSMTADGEVVGNPEARANLIGIGRQVFAWFSWMAILFTLLIIPAGLMFLAEKDPGGFTWRTPWIATAVLTGISLAMQPAFSLLEGCRQVATVNRSRVCQAMSGNLAVWLVLLAGGGLWAAVASAAVRLAWDAAIVFIQFPRFFQMFRQPAPAVQNDWRAELWPLQWRIAVQSVFQYFNNWLFTLVVFEMYGAADAGRMGMTWSILTAMQAAAAAWVQTRASLFGTLAAAGDFRELDRVFRRLIGLSVIVMIVAGVLVTSAVATLSAVHSATDAVQSELPSFIVRLAGIISPRLIDARPTAIFCAALLAQNLANALGMYVRAHKRDPFLIVNFIAALVSASLVFVLTARYRFEGAAWALLIATCTTMLPCNVVIWTRFRKERDSAPEASARPESDAAP